MASHSITHHTLDRPLVGAEQGYRRLARLLVRAFYSGEMPPPEDDAGAAGGAPPADGAPPPAPRRAAKHSTAGLAVLLVDYLARVDGYCDEAAIAADLRLPQKSVRRTLRALEGERLVAAQAVKLSLRRRGAEAPDDAEVEERRRQETHVFWTLDFPRIKDSLRLRLLRARELLRRAAGGAGAIAEYVCAACGCRYTALDASRLAAAAAARGRDAFACEECGGDVAEHVDDPGGRGGGGGGAAAPRRERAAFFRGLAERFEAQLRPLTEQLERLKDVDPPDPGSLQDWWAARKAEAERRAARLEAARKRAREAGAGAGMTDGQLLDWLDRAEVAVALPGAPPGGGGGGAPGGGAAPGKELPAWFRGEGAPAAPAGGAADAAAADAAAEERRRLEERYLQQYLAAVQQQQQQQQAAVAGAAGGGAEGEPPAKRAKAEVKAEAAAAPAAAPAAAAPPKKEEEAAWEDVGAGDDAAWEDA